MQSGPSSIDREDPLNSLSDAELRAAFADLDEELAKGIADADEARLSDGEAFFAELEESES